MKIVLFGGTIEGREKAIVLTQQGNDVTVSVTSDYAKSLLPADMPCHVGRLDAESMLAFLTAQAPDLVMDATHPYAVIAHATIAQSCQTLGLPLTCIQRSMDDADWRESVTWADDTDAAITLLQSTAGPILLTTGSKTIGQYAAALPADRLWVRVLPTHAALDLCLDAGIPAKQIIAMQGPFTEALNAATYDMLGIRVMVTKDSGTAGGVAEKVLPALVRGIHVIVIRRP